jgi:hypothetical protein
MKNKNQPKTVAQLRHEGCKVRVSHHRFPQSGNPQFSPHFQYHQALLKESRVAIDPKGGYTEVEITMPDGKVVNGRAYCSLQDTFNRKVGLVKALGRALGAQKRSDRALIRSIHNYPD